MTEGFMAWPFWARVAAMLFLAVCILWPIFRKIILWVLSGIPFLLRKIFRVLYLLIEVPVSALHKKFGSIFYEADNKLSAIGGKIDAALTRWYETWRSPGQIHYGKCLLVYVICVIFVVAPPFIKSDSSFLKIGTAAYTSCESFFVNLFIRNGWYDPYAAAASGQEEEQEELTESVSVEIEDFEEKLVVSGVSETLLVRSKPSVKNGKILERLANGDRVTWNGKMRFAKAEDEHIEPWVKIVTKNGVEGWCRLFYLHPKENKKKVFQVIAAEK